MIDANQTRHCGKKGLPEVKPFAFFLRFTSPSHRGVQCYNSLEEAQEVAWDMRREGKLRPVEILDGQMNRLMDRAALRAWLDLQDRDWPEIEDGGDLPDLGDAGL